jgi:hypothetical protein
MPDKDGSTHGAPRLWRTDLQRHVPRRNGGTTKGSARVEEPSGELPSPADENRSSLRTRRYPVSPKRWYRPSQALTPREQTGPASPSGGVGPFSFLVGTTPRIPPNVRGIREFGARATVTHQFLPHTLWFNQRLVLVCSDLLTAHKRSRQPGCLVPAFDGADFG